MTKYTTNVRVGSAKAASSPAHHSNSQSYVHCNGLTANLLLLPHWDTCVSRRRERKQPRPARGFVAACFLSTLLFLIVGVLRERQHKAEGLLWKHAASDGASAPPGLLAYRPRAKTAATEVEVVAGGHSRRESTAL